MGRDTGPERGVVSAVGDHDLTWLLSLRTRAPGPGRERVEHRRTHHGVRWLRGSRGQYRCETNQGEACYKHTKPWKPAHVNPTPEAAHTGSTARPRRRHLS